MGTSEIQDAMLDAIVARGCFIVDIKVTKNNEVTLVVESEEKVVTLDDCVALSEVFEQKFDREKEDYELTVTSAGLDQPFVVLKQYLKAMGTMVEVSLKGGRKIVGTLQAADENGISLVHSERRKVEGSKKKETVEVTEPIPYSEINATLPHIEF